MDAHYICPLSSAKCISGSSVCTFRDTINRSINSQVRDRRPTATNDDHYRGRFVDSWEFVSAPPVSSLHLHISREYLLRLRNSGIRRANHRHVPTAAIHENIGRGAGVYFAARWKTPGIRPINLRSWNWFAGFNHRELFLTGVALSFPPVLRLLVSFSARPARPPPQNFRNFPRSIGPRIRPKSNSLRIGNGRSWKGYLFEALWTLFSQNGGSSTEFYRSREPVVCERFNDCGIQQRRMDILCEIIISICCDGLRYEK